MRTDQAIKSTNKADNLAYIQQRGFKRYKKDINKTSHKKHKQSRQGIYSKQVTKNTDETSFKKCR